MSSSGRKGEGFVDPRILANQQKIIDYLRRVQEDQHSLKKDVHMLMKESKHFQKNIYQNIQVLSQNVNSLQDNVDELLNNTDSIDHKTKSIYKHVKRVNSRQDLMSSPSGSLTEQNIRPRKRHGKGAVARPKMRHSDGLLHPEENHVGRYSPSSDTDFGPKKVNLPAKDYNNSDPNLLLPRLNGTERKSQTKEKKPQKDYLDITDGTETLSSQDSDNNDSPVSIRNQPPGDIPRPKTKKGKKKKKKTNVNDGPYLPLDGHEQIGLPQPPLVTTNISQKECVQLMRQYGLDLVSETLVCIERATQSRGARRWQIGLRTVLVVDISTSMRGGPLNTAKSFLNGMLDCVDIGADRFALEEFISLIICGGENTTILQPFSNDYVHLRTVISEGLENYEEGRSPLFQALAMALTYIECHGDAVSVYNHDMLPRIVILSDFLITDEKNLDGDDVATSEERIRCQGQLFKFMDIVRKRGYQTYCVPVGDYNDHICREVARIGNGTVIETDRPQEAGNYYRYQVIAGNCLHEYNQSQEEGEEEDIEELVTDALITAGLPAEDKDIVIELITTALNKDSMDNDLEEEEIENDAIGAEGGVSLGSSKPASYQQGIQLSRHNHSQQSSVGRRDSVDSFGDLPEWRVPRGTTNLSVEEIGRLPPLGTRVQRGKDWAWDRQDGQGPGTIIAHKTEGVVFVLWDNNNQVGGYRYGHQGDNYDVEVIRSPRQVDHGCIEIGCWVVRGRDWNKGDEDGGQGTVGTVIRKLPGRLVKVRWPSRVIDDYKFGADDLWEVRVTMEASLSQRASRTHTPDQAAIKPAEERPAIPGEEDTQPVWRWQDRSNQWRIMSPDAIIKLEQTYTRNQQGNVMVQVKGKNAKVYLGSMECELNGSKRPIQRELMKVSDTQNLQMVEEMMQD